MTTPNYYPSLASLRAAHSELLKQREHGDTPEVIAAMNGFIQRGQVTGTLLDLNEDRKAAQSLLNYWAALVYRTGNEPPDATLAEFDLNAAPEIPDDPCPYLGLDAFREKDQSVFFGRHRLIKELILKITEERLLAVLGPSGSGKSSLVRAGLIPSLKEDALPNSRQWFYFPPMVPGSNPLANLVNMINAEAASSQIESLRNDPHHLEKFIAENFKGDVVLVIDQFEEIFTLCTDDLTRQAFVNNLVGLAQTPDAEHRVILTMRTDFESQVVRLPEFEPLFEKALVRVTPLNANDLREAIEAPAHLIGLKFEEGLVNALLQDILGEPAALPLLQFTLLKLWESRKRNRVTWEVYKRLGGGRQALAKTADDFYNNLIPEEQVTAKRILLKLVRPGEGLEVTSNRLRRSQLYYKAEAGYIIDNVLDKFFRARLLRLTEGDSQDDAQIEVAHEALIRNWPRLVMWLEDERAELRQRQRVTTAAEQWQTLGKDPGALWRGVQLNEAKRYEDLNELESAFIQASQNAVEAERAAHEAARQTERDLENTRKLAQFEKDRRRVVTILGAVALVTSFIAIFFWSQANTSASIARDAAGTSQANAITAQVASTQAVNAATQSAKAEAFANISLTSAVSERNVAATAQSFALTALSRQLAAQARSYLSSDLTLAFLLGVESLTTYNTSEANTVLRDAVERKLTRTTEPLAGRPIPEQEAFVLDVTFNADGKKLAWAVGSAVMLWDIESQRQTRLFDHYNFVNTVTFSADNKWLASGDRGGTVIIWDVIKDMELYRFTIKDAPQILPMAFSPNSQILAYGRSDGKIGLWDMVEKKLLLTIDAHQREVLGLAWSPDSQYLASGSLDEQFRVWKADTGEAFLTPQKIHRGSVSGVVWSSDGKWIVTSGGLDRTLVVRNATTGEVIAQTKAEHTEELISLTLSHDNKIIASGSRDKTIVLWDISDPKSLQKSLTLTEHTGIVTAISFSPIENILASSGYRVVLVRKILIPPQSDLPLKDRACALATRNFSRAEWEQFFAGQSYRKTCVQFAEGK